jgi:hypothetical protein
MGRRTSGQQVGLQSIGNVQASASTLTTTQPNSDLTLDPNGTGNVVVQASLTLSGDLTIQNQGDLRLSEATANGTNYIAMQAAANMATNYTITWPAAVTGSSGYVLSSDTSGNLSWVAQTTAGISISDPGSDATTYYPIFVTNAGSIVSGQTTALNNKANLTFVPSTGELFATIGRYANVVGSNATSGTLTLRGTSSATKAAASILMTDNVTSTTTATGTLVVTGGVGVSGQITCSSISATSITETSSITFKENVNPITNALDAIALLSGVTYDRKDGSSTNEAGLIAEEVFKILPNLVQLDENGNPLGIKYTKLTAYLIESVKSLKAKIDFLESGK